MAVKSTKYARKPFYIDAVQVTADNIQEVAEWCQGEIREEDEIDNAKSPRRKYVKVRVHRPLNERQTKAYIGDYVLYAGTGYKVYTFKAFNNSFDPIEGTARDHVTQSEKAQTLTELFVTHDPSPIVFKEA